MAKNIRSIKETTTGRNVKFQDIKTRETMTRAQLVNEIKRGSQPDYHIREINGIKTPVSNPDKKTSNNLS